MFGLCHRMFDEYETALSPILLFRLMTSFFDCACVFPLVTTADDFANPSPILFFFLFFNTSFAALLNLARQYLWRCWDNPCREPDGITSSHIGQTNVEVGPSALEDIIF